MILFDYKKELYLKSVFSRNWYKVFYKDGMKRTFIHSDDTEPDGRLNIVRMPNKYWNVSKETDLWTLIHINDKIIKNSYSNDFI